MSSQKTERCQNCFKHFPQAKINSHYSYCRRNFKPCPICRQMYDINFQEEHQKQFHSFQLCKYCNLQFSSQQTQTHLLNCLSKPKICDFCEQQIPKQLLAKHVQQCGARTQICLVCNKNVMLKQYDRHFNQCVHDTLPKQEENNRFSNSRSIRFNDNIYGSVDGRETSINTVINPGGTFGFYQPTGITTVQSGSTIGISGNYRPTNFNNTNQINQSRIPINNQLIPPYQHQPQPQYYQNPPQHFNPTNMYSSTQSNNTTITIPRIIQPQPISTIVPQPQLSQSIKPPSQSGIKDDQNQMLQRVMMESLQSNRQKAQYPQYQQPAYYPPNYSQHSQIPHLNQSRNQQQTGFGFTSETLNDKTLLQDIQMQEQIINSMKRNQQASNVQGSFLRTNPGSTRW